MKPREFNHLNHQGWIDYFPINTYWSLDIPIIPRPLLVPLISQIMQLFRGSLLVIKPLPRENQIMDIYEILWD